MNEDQLIEAAEREMGLYRDEITRLLAGRDEIRADLDRLRERVARTAAKLDADALATAPSKKSEIQAETAARLRETLGDGA